MAQVPPDPKKNNPLKVRLFVFAAVFTVCSAALADDCETGCTNSELTCVTRCSANDSCSKECLKQTERCIDRCARPSGAATQGSQCDAEFQSLEVINDGSSSVFNMGAGSADCRNRKCTIKVLFRVKNQDGNWTGPWSATFILQNQTEQQQQVPAGGRFDPYPEVQVDSIQCN